jgi:1-phosphofructokinase family hexose kinase
VIVTVTLNPMLDKTVDVESLRRGATTRAAKVGAVVGGKGINVSRQLRMLGDETLATGFVGGEVGTQLERMLDAEGITHQFVRVAGLTREGVTYREADGTMTSVFEPPHPVTADETARLLEKVKLLSHGSKWVVCSGSSPSAAADGAFREIVAFCRLNGIPVVLDSYGPPFALAVAAGPSLIKPNRHELEETFGLRVSGEADMIAAAREMVARGIGYCIITDGARTFVAASVDHTWLVTPPAVEAVNPTGSGDSMIAALLHALVHGRPFQEAVAYGAAAGAVNAGVWTVAAASSLDIDKTAAMVRIRKV